MRSRVGAGPVFPGPAHIYCPRPTSKNHSVALENPDGRPTGDRWLWTADGTRRRQNRVRSARGAAAWKNFRKGGENGANLSVPETALPCTCWRQGRRGVFVFWPSDRYVRSRSAYPGSSLSVFGLKLPVLGRREERNALVGSKRKGGGQIARASTPSGAAVTDGSWRRRERHFRVRRWLARSFGRRSSSREWAGIPAVGVEHPSRPTTRGPGHGRSASSAVVLGAYRAECDPVPVLIPPNHHSKHFELGIKAYPVRRELRTRINTQECPEQPTASDDWPQIKRMSVLMGLSEYPLATRDPAQPQQFGYQWPNNTRTSPNSMGSTNNSPSPLNSNAPPMNNPTAPSPLIGQPNMGPPTSGSNNQDNSTPPLSNHGGTPPQQENDCSQVIKSPFDDEIRCVSRNPQMPTPPTPFEHFRNMLLATKYNYVDLPHLRSQLPPCCNTLQGQNFITSMYPPVRDLNRSPCTMVHPPRLPPQMMMPQQPPPAPAQPPPKKKRQTKKEKEEQKKREEEEKRIQLMQQSPQHMMMQNPQMFGHMPPNQFMGGPMPGQMPMPMMAMDPNRPSSSEMPDPRLMSPNTMPPHMKGHDGFAVPGPVMNRFKPMPERIVEANHPCALCQHPVSCENRGVRCTANGTGCQLVFHASCVNISPESLYTFHMEPQCEWSCGGCAKRRFF